VDDDSSERGADAIGSAGALLALGGPGFSVPMGLFMAGVSVSSAFLKLLPKWLVVPGMILLWGASSAGSTW
jgi:hypothetical protein